MMKDRVLIVASVASMIDQFNMPNIRLLQEMGFDVDVACNFIDGNTCSHERTNTLKENLSKLNVGMIQIDFCRSPFKIFRNLKAYHQLLSLMQHYHYKFVHCHSPIGGLCARIAAYKTHIKSIYTAHGFHFYKGAPLINWLVYYPIELWMSCYTDVLITINHEDYDRSLRFFAKKTEYIPGVGVNLSVFHRATLEEKRTKRAQLNLGLHDTDFVCVCVGELNKNKNQIFLLKALKELVQTHPNVKMLIVGQGVEAQRLRAYITDNNLSANAFLLGYRTDIPDILNACDMGVSASIREGLGINIIEHLASGLPVVCSDNRGHRDISKGNPVVFYDVGDLNQVLDVFNKQIMNFNIKKEKKVEPSLACYEKLNILSKMEQVYINLHKK